uniref:Uncharacterized protein n=1 Tax=Candidatus Kentrum sp. LPFa TaxID=2126335 RepID=A0A450WL63_9GAMM|nr:MAG: hypothetical protein BECKLPF1236B_GA0070989_11245 [Candidatus Kentron sp. LPFa]
MLDEIVKHPDLFGLLRHACEEHDVCVTVCDELMENGDLRQDLIAILKIDAYFKTPKFSKPPKSIDCLIIIKTGERKFGLTLVELKNVSDARSLRPREIEPKFDTTIDDFLSGEFKSIFMNPGVTISYLHLWLIANPYKWSPERYRKKLKDTVLGMYLSKKPKFSFRNKVAGIKPMHPDDQDNVVCLPGITESQR